MEDPSAVKHNHNNRYAVNASPLIANGIIIIIINRNKKIVE